MQNTDLDTETIQARKDKSLKNKYGTQEARILQNSNTIMAFMSIQTLIKVMLEILGVLWECVIPY
jgi:hypothetical protein